ncbi:MAG: DUF447 family protein [Thaumarchaeota archaeon]|nr:DUF447 family protein [Candidatus Calditenuaceae archaeon]MDW8041946.1 DUF447 family protein [Nitrososphaerota archaeon]
MDPGEDLWALGIEEGVVYEFVCTTYNVDGTPHASAMGCRFLRDRGGVTAFSKLSKTSRASGNVLRRGSFVLNVVDPEVVVEAALDSGVLSLEFEVSERVDAPRLKGAAACLELSVSETSEDEFWVHLRSRPLAVIVRGPNFKPFSRGHAALLEAAVHASRIPIYRQLGDSEKVEELKSRVSYFLETVARLAPTPTLLAQSRAIERMYLRPLQTT